MRCQKTLRGIGQCFPRAEDAAVVGRDETVALGKDLRRESELLMMAPSRQRCGP